MECSTSHSGRTSSAEAQVNDGRGSYAGEVDSHDIKSPGEVEPMVGVEAGFRSFPWDRKDRRGPPPQRRRSIEVVTVEEPSASPLTGPAVVPGAPGSLVRSDSWPPHRRIPAQMVPSVIKVPDHWQGDASLWKWADAGVLEHAFRPPELAAAREALLKEQNKPR